VTWKAWNLNNRVRFKLTDHGAKVLADRHIERLKGMRPAAVLSDGDVHPKPDKNGIVEMQMWELIQTFGPHMHWGREPFSMDVEIETT
jgi:hypothetical protein